LKAEIIVENGKPILLMKSESAGEDDLLDAVDLLENYTMRFEWFGEQDTLEHKVSGD
jgi:fructoselysine-6-P-deglycase FrlB-like protein